MRRPVLRLLCASLLVLTACGDKEKWAEKQQQQLQAAKAEAAKAEQQVAAKPVEPPAPSDPFWDDPSLVKMNGGSACPEGLWALFKGPAPGNDAAEKKANEARRGELVQKLKGTRFVTRLKAPTDVKLLEYDLRKAEYPVEVTSVIDCTDSGGHIAVAFGDAKAGVPGASAAQQDRVVQQNAWMGKPLPFELPIKTQAEAKAFAQGHRFDVEARIIYKLGRTDIDRKMFKQPKVKEGEIEMGGGMEDWGAGRMVRAEVEAIRLATDRGTKSVLEKKTK